MAVITVFLVLLVLYTIIAFDGLTNLATGATPSELSSKHGFKLVSIFLLTGVGIQDINSRLVYSESFSYGPYAYRIAFIRHSRGAAYFLHGCRRIAHHLHSLRYVSQFSPESNLESLESRLEKRRLTQHLTPPRNIWTRLRSHDGISRHRRCHGHCWSQWTNST